MHVLRTLRTHVLVCTAVLAHELVCTCARTFVCLSACVLYFGTLPLWPLIYSWLGGFQFQLEVTNYLFDEQVCEQRHLGEGFEWNRKLWKANVESNWTWNRLQVLYQVRGKCAGVSLVFVTWSCFTWTSHYHVLHEGELVCVRALSHLPHWGRGLFSCWLHVQLTIASCLTREGGQYWHTWMFAGRRKRTGPVCHGYWN